MPNNYGWLMKHATPEEQTAQDIVSDPLAACSETEMERLIVEAIRAEREACADLCMYNEYGIECAKAIRARGEPK